MISLDGHQHMRQSFSINSPPEVQRPARVLLIANFRHSVNIWTLLQKQEIEQGSPVWLQTANQRPWAETRAAGRREQAVRAGPRSRGTAGDPTAVSPGSDLLQLHTLAAVQLGLRRDKLKHTWNVAEWADAKQYEMSVLSKGNNTAGT